MGYGMGYAKWDMQKEISQAGQIGFGEVKWDTVVVLWDCAMVGWWDGRIGRAERFEWFKWLRIVCSELE